MQKIDHALALAAQGFRVFPLVPDKKKPLIDAWPEAATSESERIRQWWAEWPNANIGVTGEDLIIVDIDEKDGRHGSRTLMALEIQHTDLPATPTSRTPTGGQHIFLRTQKPIANSVQKLGQGLDIRGRGGYVVAPGSTLDGVAYEWSIPPQSTPIADAPDWLLHLAGTSKQRDKETPTQVGDLDSPGAIHRGEAFLKTREPAVLRSGSNSHTHLTAKRLLDFGLSVDAAWSLMLDHWNERCSPPWPPEKLLKMVENAAEYRQEPIGSKNPEAEFDPVEINQEPVNQKKRVLTATPVDLADLESIDEPEWVWGHWAARTYVTMLVAAPGVGKTNVGLALAVAKASGRDDITDRKVHGAGRVWFISGEDSIVDVQRRLAAVLVKHQVPREDLNDENGKGRLFVNSAQDERIRLAAQDEHGNIRAVDAAAIEQQIIENKIDMLILDPLVELHTANENDNGQMSDVMSHIRGLAWNTRAAVIVVHHSRKKDKASTAGQEGDQDSSRGAGAVVGSCRIVLTLTGMSEKRAKVYGVGDNARHRYIALDVAKNNIGPKDPEPLWFEQSGIAVNAKGFEVGVVSPAALEVLENSNGQNDVILKLAIDGILATVGEEKWTPIGPLVEHVMAHDAFFGGKDVNVVRRCVRAALTAAVEAEPAEDDRWFVEKQGETTRSVMYRILPTEIQD